jgi:subtilisin family serine protease
MRLKGWNAAGSAALICAAGMTAAALPWVHCGSVRGPAVAHRSAAGEVVRRVSTAALPSPDAWQLGVIHEDAVPDAVLHAAASIRIAVIDTGADLSAPAIATKRPAAYNVRTRTTDVRDLDGHGTMVASIAAGSPLAGAMTGGAGGDARLMIIKASSTGSFTDVDEAAAITYAVGHGARIINLSFGGVATSSVERAAIRYAIGHGVLVVAAAGNEYASGNPVEYPAALLQPVGSNGNGGAGLVVGASTQNGQRAPFSSTGSWISLAAPGVDILTDASTLSSPTLHPRVSAAGLPAGVYGYASGTSFAAPLVAGAAALVWAANPSLTAQQVAEILKHTASGEGHWTPDLGFGVVDVGAAVARAQSLVSPVPDVGQTLSR